MLIIITWKGGLGESAKPNGGMKKTMHEWLQQNLEEAFNIFCPLSAKHTKRQQKNFKFCKKTSLGTTEWVVQS